MSADRIRAARELLGMSQEQLSSAAGISQALISQIENGNRAATDQTLDAVISGTGLPKQFFARDPDPLATGSLRFRKYRSAPARATVRAKRTFIELFDIAALLMDWADRPKPSLPRAAETTTLDAIEHFADETRARMGLGPSEPIGHLTRALERASVPVAPIAFVDLSGEESDEFAALGHFGLSACDRASGRASIGYFASSGDRQRFTLAHELGHIVLHTEGSPEPSAAELEADQFAGAFLFPRVARSEFRRDPTLRDFAHLKARWGVSIQALVMRAAALGAIDELRRVSLYKQISARGWRHNEPVLVSPEEPLLLGALLAQRYGQQRSAYTRAAADLGIPAVYLRAVVPLQDSGQSSDGTTGARILALGR